jgi:hypothetical protein
MSINGRIEQLEDAAQEQYEPAYSDDTMSCWLAAVAYSVYCHERGGRDAVEFSALPAELKSQLGSCFAWRLNVHLGALVPEALRYKNWQRDFDIAVAGLLDIALEDGASQEALEMPGALSEVMVVVLDCLEHWQEEVS